MPGLFFPMGQDISKIGILINENFIMHLIFHLSEFSLLFDDVFCCRQTKFKCRNLKRKNNVTCCSKVQRQKTSQGTHSRFVWDEKCCEETFGLVET